jgi:hypothetical protein
MLAAFDGVRKRTGTRSIVRALGLRAKPRHHGGALLGDRVGDDVCRLVVLLFSVYRSKKLTYGNNRPLLQ